MGAAANRKLLASINRHLGVTPLGAHHAKRYR
jgi:hypothetical protein